MPDPMAESIRESEDRRILKILNWEAFLKEVQRFCPSAKLSSPIHDEWLLEGVDPEDPHFKRHLDAFQARVPSDCEDPVCVVHEVHGR